MTAGAIATHIGMIKHRAAPGVGAVAVITLVATGDVIGWLALGLLAVVTGGTTAPHLGMIHPGHRIKGIGAMTALAGIGGGNVFG